MSTAQLPRYDDLYIGGEWRPAAEATLVQVTSAATGEPIGYVPAGSAADVDAAVAAARAAFDEGPWPAMTGAERGQHLRRLAAALQPHIETIATLIAQETGSPITWGTNAQARGAIGLLDYYGRLAERSAESTRAGRDATIIVRKEPVGVVGAIVPFNVPLFIAAAKIGPALAVGCTVVVKAPPEAPLSFFVLARAVAEAGLPAGVLNIVTGDGQVGAALVRHPGVDKISFTGSSATGAAIARECATGFRRISLELGGKSAAIVLDDADPARVAPELVSLGMPNNGQACATQSRILVPDALHDAMVDELVTVFAGLSVGDPLDPSTDVGPLVNERQHTKVLGFVRGAVADGAHIAVGCGRPAHLPRGWYVEPTIVTEVRNDMHIAQEEIFGPVLCVVRYTDDDEAVRIANDSRYGLAGSVWTTDPQRGLAIARRVRTGNFGINRMGIDTGAPFGGFKHSGIGREFGPEALDEFVEIKTIVGV